MKVLLTAALAALLASSALGHDVAVGRLSYTEGDVWILKDLSVHWTDAVPNMVIQKDDIIETGRKSRAEIELCMGAVLWLNSHTRAEVLYLGLNEASVYISYGVARVKNVRDNQLVIETDRSSIYLDVESDARIEVGGDGKTEVCVLDGWVTIETAEEIKTIWEGEKVCVTYSGKISERYAGSPDGFDRFCSCRCERYTRLYVDVGVFLGCCDLDYYGTWVYVHPYGRVWRPHVVVGWRPFFCGYWFWDVSFGWIWISFEPWGFLPYHYGHWVWCPGYGWVWDPGNRWSPGWVVWVYDGPNIGWAPAGPGGAPPIDADCWTFVSQESFYSGSPVRQIDYKEAITNHPIYDIKKDIPKNRIREVNFSAAPGPKLTEVSKPKILSDEYTAAFEKPLFKEKTAYKDEGERRGVPERSDEFSRREGEPIRQEVYTPTWSSQAEKANPEQERLIVKEPSHSEYLEERKRDKPRDQYSYKPSPAKKEIKKQVYTPSETQKIDRAKSRKKETPATTEEIKSSSYNNQRAPITRKSTIENRSSNTQRGNQKADKQKANRI